jgi:hypothetical protein
MGFDERRREPDEQPFGTCDWGGCDAVALLFTERFTYMYKYEARKLK